jgi:hypothetical protein
MMPLSEIFFLGIVLYLLYRFVFNFLVPVVKTTRQVRRQFMHMQDTMQGQGPEPFRPKQPDPPPSSSSKGTMGEYIDFEEIK